jgi:hypothetical protein
LTIHIRIFGSLIVGFGAGELRVDAHSILISLHRAFEHIANAELLLDLTENGARE